MIIGTSFTLCGYGTLSSGATCTTVGQNCPAWPGNTVTVDGRAQGADVSSYVVWWGDVLRGPTTTGGPQYLRNRYYDAATGRFTQLDPIGLAGGMNLYGFADGDPVNFSDPMGLCPPQDDDYSSCTGFFTVLGATAGSLIGGTTGGAGGAALCAPSGPVAIACAAGGGIAGVAKGAAR